MTAQEIIEKIRAEIERLKIEREGFRDAETESELSAFYNGQAMMLDEVLNSLSNLEKECGEKPMNQDLEKELARFYLKDLCGSEKDEIPEATLHHNFPIMWDDLRDIARHFALT